MKAHREDADRHRIMRETRQRPQWRLTPQPNCDPTPDAVWKAIQDGMTYLRIGDGVRFQVVRHDRHTRSLWVWVGLSCVYTGPVTRESVEQGFEVLRS